MANQLQPEPVVSVLPSAPTTDIRPAVYYFAEELVEQLFQSGSGIAFCQHESYSEIRAQLSRRTVSGTSIHSFIQFIDSFIHSFILSSTLLW